MTNAKTKLKLNLKQNTVLGYMNYRIMAFAQGFNIDSFAVKEFQLAAFQSFLGNLND